MLARGSHHPFPQKGDAGSSVCGKSELLLVDLISPCVLVQCCLYFDVYMNHLEILLECRFWVSMSGVRPEIVHLTSSWVRLLWWLVLVTGLGDWSGLSPTVWIARSRNVLFLDWVWESADVLLWPYYSCWSYISLRWLRHKWIFWRTWPDFLFFALSLSGIPFCLPLLPISSWLPFIFLF